MSQSRDANKVEINIRPLVVTNYYFANNWVLTAIHAFHKSQNRFEFEFPRHSSITEHIVDDDDDDDDAPFEKGGVRYYFRFLVYRLYYNNYSDRGRGRGVFKVDGTQ